ncbi:MAG: RNA methyltransferase, partial [Rickettsiales bacterium]|nr:RNA methyltransferase [Rickettsiales bacterium]
MSLSIILVRPQLGENIGAAARVMKNFDITDLRIVAPRDGWPNQAAIDMSAGAKDVIEQASIYETLEDALGDLHYVMATTARIRQMEKPMSDARSAITNVIEDGHKKTGILFGPERSGLENEDIALCDALLTIPVSDVYGSLNLAQSVAICCYEWHMLRSSSVEENPVDIAEKQELFGFFEQLELALDSVNFWRVPEKKAAMWQTIRHLFTRMQPSN